MESVPPETLQKAMAELFEGKIATTFESCKKARAELGWPEKGCSVWHDCLSLVLGTKDQLQDITYVVNETTRSRPYGNIIYKCLG